MATAAAAFSGFLLPWEVAFSQPEELYHSLNHLAPALVRGGRSREAWVARPLPAAHGQPC